ncbi:MAG TPA: hypothetical protein VJC39_01850 [Candidatus Nanoarchaeia archaeon]|nr:hypothetical protein [Candidatus Nanoarchaeia archaeon]
MVEFSILGIAILALLLLFFRKFISVALQVGFYLLIGTFIVMFFFGVSLVNIIDWILKIILWVF